MLNKTFLSSRYGTSAKVWDILKIATLMIWGEEDTALGKELTYGTEEYVQNLRIRYISTVAIGCSKSNRSWLIK